MIKVNTIIETDGTDFDGIALIQNLRRDGWMVYVDAMMGSASYIITTDAPMTVITMHEPRLSE